MRKIFGLLLVGIILGSSTTMAAMKTFSDVPYGLWYSEAVYHLSELGIIGGYNDGTFRPQNTVNRAELAVIIDRVVEKIQTGEISLIKKAPLSYQTKLECENANNCRCDFVMCDYVPAGKTFEEVCGLGFQEGFQCVD